MNINFNICIDEDQQLNQSIIKNFDIESNQRNKIYNNLTLNIKLIVSWSTI